MRWAPRSRISNIGWGPRSSPSSPGSRCSMSGGSSPGSRGTDAIELGRDPLRIGLHLRRQRRQAQARLRIDRAQRAEEAAVAAHDRPGDVALDAIERGRVMRAPGGIGLDVVDIDALAARADLVADRCLDRQLVAGVQPELDLV